MSGFGMFEQYEAGMELAERGIRFREDAFLQQLSRNGSLMLAVNHDELWRECMQEMLGQPPGASWEWMCGLLRAMPAGDARRRLWRASHLWWVNMQRYRLRILVSALRGGSFSQVAGRPALCALGETLILRGQQLDQLSWCLVDIETAPIPVVEEVSVTPKRVKKTRVTKA